MSKTLGSILVIGAAIAVNVIPGAGQAISAFLLGTVGLSVGTAVAVSGVLTTAITSAGITAGLSVAGSVFSGRPAQRADTTESSRKSPIPARTRAYGQLRLYGDWLLYTTKSDGAPVDVWAFHDGPASAVLQVYLNDDKVTIVGGVVQQLTDKRYRDSKVLAGYNLGAPTETAHAAVVAALPGIWTANHRGDGIVTGYLIKKLTKADKFLETYPNGDDIQMSLAAQWAPVYDFRDEAQSPTDPSTWEYRDNTVLALCHFFITERGYDFETAILPQIDKWVAAADDCDSTVPLAGGGSEARYRLALAYKAVETPSAVQTAIMATCDGWFCENERGEIVVYSGRYYAPTVEIGPDQIVSYTVQRHVAAEDAINEVLITYVSAEHEYNTVDAQSWRNQDAIDASGRAPVSTTLEAQIPSATQGRRLAKRRMIRANAPARGSIVTTFGGRAALGERYINLRIEEAGAIFYEGPAEIVGSPERDMQTGGVRFDWVAADPEIDAWDPEEETGDPTTVGELPEIEPLDPPSITSALFFESGEDGARIRITGSGPDRDDLTWMVRWRIGGSSTWGGNLEFSDTDPGASVVLETDVLPTGSDVEVQIKYLTGDGRSSDWSDAVTVSTGSVTFDSSTIRFDATTITMDRDS